MNDKEFVHNTLLIARQNSEIFRLLIGCLVSAPDLLQFRQFPRFNVRLQINP